MADNRYGVNISPESEAALEELYAPQALDLDTLSQYMPSMPSAGIPSAGGGGGANANLRTGMQYLMSQYGLQPHQAAAMIGNFAQESGGNTGARGGNILPGEAFSYGLAQHNKERLHGGGGYTGLIPYAQQQGRDPSDLYTQLDYVMQELQGPEKKAYDALLQAPDLESATVAFGRAYERPSEKYANYQNRIAQARAYLGEGPQASPFEMVPLDNGQTIEVERGMDLGTVADMLKQNGVNAVPLRNFQTPRGALQVPFNMTDEQVTGLLQKQQPALLMEPGKKPPETGMLPAGIAGLESGIGAAGVGIGEVLGRAGKEFESPTLTGWGQKAAEFGKGMERRAEETYRPPTEEEIKQMGPLDWASAKIGQPASYMLGRVGAPLVAGAVTRMPSVALAGLGAQSVANVTEPAAAKGVEVSNPELAMHAMVDTALNFFRFPAIGPLRSLVVDGMSPALRKGVETAIRAGDTEAAQQLISGRVMQVAKAIPENFATNLVANVGQEANIRSTLGQDIASPEALEEYKKQIEPTALMALPFGVHQGLAARAGQMRQVEDMAAQQQIEQARLQQEQQPAPETLEEPEDLGIELPPVEEPTIRGQEPPAGAAAAPGEPTPPSPAPAPAGVEAAPTPYYDTLGLSTKSNIYKELKTRDINDPANVEYISNILDGAINNPRLKVKNVEAMMALRDQLRPPVQEQAPTPPTPPAVEPTDIAARFETIKSAPSSDQEKHAFFMALPEGAIFSSDPDVRAVVGPIRTAKNGAVSRDITTQVFNRETGQWEDNKQAFTVATDRHGEAKLYGDIPGSVFDSFYIDADGNRQKQAAAMTLPGARTETPAPKKPPAPVQAAPRTPEEITAEYQHQAKLHNSALQTGDAEGLANARNRLDALRKEFTQLPQEVRDAFQKSQASTPDGGSGAQPSVRKKGRDQAVGRQGMEPSGQGVKTPEAKVPEPPKPQEVTPPEPVAAAPAPKKARITRKPPKGATPEETTAAVAATETAKEPPAEEPKAPVVEEPKVEAPATPEQAELTKLRGELEQAKTKHQELKAAQTKAFHGKGPKAEAKFAEIEKQIEENKRKGIAAKQRIAEIEHAQLLKEQAAVEEAPPVEEPKVVARKKLTEEATPEQIEAEAEKGAAAIAQRLTQMKAEKEAQKKADTAVAEAEGKVPAKAVPTKAPAVTTPAEIKAKIAEATHPAANLKRRRTAAAKKKEAPPKPALGKPEIKEQPFRRPNLAGIFGYDAPHPQWARRAPTAFSHPKVIYSNGNFALISGRNRAGRVLTAAHLTDQKGITFTSTSESIYDGLVRNPHMMSKLSREQISDLVKAELAYQEEQNLLDKEFPEGPFTGHKEPVVMSAGVPKELGEILKSWMHMLNIADTKVFLTTFNDVSGTDAIREYGLHGPWGDALSLADAPSTARGAQRYSVPEQKGSVIAIRYEGGDITPRLLETLAHELGHHFEDATFRNAPPEVKDAIIAEFKKYQGKYTQKNAQGRLEAIPGKMASEMVSDLRAYHAAQENIQKGLEQGDVPVSSIQKLDYWLGFPEWFADQVAKWATSSEKPLTAVEKFFKGIADGLRKLYASLTGQDAKYLPNPVMKRYLDAREKPTLEDVKAIVASEGTPETQLERELHPEEEQLRGRNITQRPATGPEAAARQVRNAVSTADNILNKPSYMGGLFANLRTSVIDEFAHLSRALKHLPTFDPNGKARADMLASQQRMERQFIAEALKTGFVRRSPSGFFFIEESDKNLSKLLEQAGKLKGLKDPYRALSDVLRALVGEHWIKETERLREEAGKYSDAATKWKAHAKTIKKYEDRRAADSKADLYRRKADEILKRVGEEEGQGLEKVVTPEDIAAAKALMDKVPGMKDIVDGIHKNMESLVDLHLATGMIDAATAKKWKNNPYIPLYKSMEDMEEGILSPRAGKVLGGAKSLPRVHQLMGGTHAVDVFENLQKHTALMTMAAFKNNVRRAAVDQLGMFGATRKLEPGEQQRNKQAVLVRVDGKDQYYEVNDPYIFNALQMAQPMTSELLHWLSTPTKALRAGALMNPGYWYRQLLRDPILANLVSQTGIITPFDTVKEFAKIVGGLTVGRAPKEYEVLRKHGLTGVVDPSLTDPIKFSEAVGKGSFAPMKAVKTWVAIHEAADSATRVAVYKAAMKDAKKKGYTGQTAEDYAVMRSREVINFSNRGSSNAVNAWRQVVPFFGAALNGLDVVARAATGTNLSPQEARAARQLFWGRAMAITTASMALAMYWAQNPQYASLNDDERANNWIMGFDDEGHAYKYPIPPDVGFFFKVLPEAMVHKMMGTPSHKDRGEVLKSSFLDTVVPPGLFPPIPQAFIPIIEHMTNFNIHGGYNIEPKGDAELPKELRGRSKASKLARFVSDEFGAEMGWSPAQVDHLFTAYFGGAYGAMSMITESVLKSYEGIGEDDRDVTEIYPWLKAVMSNPKNIGEKAEMYDMANEARGMVSGYRRAVGSMEPGLAGRYTTPEAMGKYALARPMKTIVDAVTKIDNEIRRMKAREEAGPEAKQRYDQLNAMKLRLMKQAAELSRRVRNKAADEQDLYEDQKKSVQDAEDEEDFLSDWSE